MAPPKKEEGQWGGETHATPLAEIQNFNAAMESLSTPGFYCPHVRNEYDFSRGNSVVPICTVVWNVDAESRCNVCGAFVDTSKSA